MIDIELDTSALNQLLNKLPLTFSGHPVLMRALAADMAAAVEENFAAQGRPAWLGLKPVQTARSAKGAARVFVQVAPVKRKILQKSGQLANSISPFSDGFNASVGTNLPYAAIHQFGGTTKEHPITPRYKQALAFGGVVRKSVQHPGSKIPARPFLSLTAQDHAHMLETASSYLASLF